MRCLVLAVRALIVGANTRACIVAARRRNHLARLARYGLAREPMRGGRARFCGVLRIPVRL